MLAAFAAFVSVRSPKRVVLVGLPFSWQCGMSSSTFASLVQVLRTTGNQSFLKSIRAAGVQSGRCGNGSCVCNRACPSFPEVRHPNGAPLRPRFVTANRGGSNCPSNVTELPSTWQPPTPSSSPTGSRKDGPGPKKEQMDHVEEDVRHRGMEPLPVTVDLLFVGSLFKAAKYRSSAGGKVQTHRSWLSVDPAAGPRSVPVDPFDSERNGTCDAEVGPLL